MNFSSPITQAIIQNITGGAVSNVPKEVKCEVCKKHKKEFHFMVRRKKKVDMNCVMCSYLCNDINDWERHVTSESHVERAKVYKPPQMPIEIPPPVQTNQSSGQFSKPAIPPLIPPTELQEMQQKLHEQLNEKALRQILAAGRKEWNCVNCNVTCQSLCSWEAHLASKKHRKNKHKFHTYPGISKEFVKRKYKNSFVRANETVGNEFIEDGVVFYCKRCEVRMETKIQLEIHMSSNQHKLNHPIAPVPVSSMPMYEEPVASYPEVQYNQQLFNFDNSSYGYGFRNWSAENYVFNKSYVPPSQAETQRQVEMDQQKQLVEEAKSKLLARFPFYAVNLQKPSEETATECPLPVPPPSDYIPLPTQRK